MKMSFSASVAALALCVSSLLPSDASAGGIWLMAQGVNSMSSTWNPNGLPATGSAAVDVVGGLVMTAGGVVLAGSSDLWTRGLGICMIVLDDQNSSPLSATENMLQTVMGLDRSDAKTVAELLMPVETNATKTGIRYAIQNVSVLDRVLGDMDAAKLAALKTALRN